MKKLFLIILLLFFVCVAKAQLYSGHLYRDSDKTTKGPQYHFSLGSVAIKTDTTFNIDSILTVSGLYPDRASYELVLQLNPGLKSLASPNLAVVMVPSLKTSKDLPVSHFLAENYLMQLDRNDTQLKMLQMQLSQAVSQPYLPGKNPEGLQAQFERSDHVLMEIGKYLKVNPGAVYFRQKDLSLIGAQVDYYKMIKTGARKEPDLLETLQTLYESFRVTNSVLAIHRDPQDYTEPYPEQEVSVTVKDPNGNKVMNMRVYFVPKALKYDTTAYDHLLNFSSPSKGWLPETNYYFWAGDPGNYKPLTEQLMQPVMRTPDGKILEFEIRALSIKKKKNDSEKNPR